MRKQNTIKNVLKFLFTTGVFICLYYSLDINFTAIYKQIVNIKFLFIALLLPLFVLPFISTNRWKLFLKEVGVEESVFHLWKINWISLFQGIILPSTQGQDFFRIYNIEKLHPQARGKSGSTVLIERLMGLILLCVISLIASLIIDIPNKKEIIVIILSITVFVIGVIWVLLSKRIYIFLSKKQSKKRWIMSVIDYVKNFHGAIVYFPYNKIMVSTVLLILCFQISTVLSVYLLFKVYGVDLPLTTHLALYPIISILSMLPITISGLGVREGLFVAFYTSLGVQPDIAVSVSIMNYIILILLPALFGGMIYMIDLLKIKRRN